MQTLGLDSQLITNEDATIHLWVCRCCFSGPILPSWHLHGDWDELYVKTSQSSPLSKTKGPDSCIIFLSLFLSQTKQLWGFEEVYQHLQAALFFPLLSSLISRFETRDNWFPLCRSVALFSPKEREEKKKVHKGVDGTITATAVEWFWMVF